MARGQNPRPTVARYDADLDEARGKFGGLRADAYVAHAGQIEAESDRMAIDGRDQRNLAIPQRFDDALHAAAIVPPRGIG